MSDVQQSPTEKDNRVTVESQKWWPFIVIALVLVFIAGGWYTIATWGPSQTEDSTPGSQTSDEANPLDDAELVNPFDDTDENPFYVNPFTDTDEPIEANEQITNPF